MRAVCDTSSPDSIVTPVVRLEADTYMTRKTGVMVHNKTLEPYVPVPEKMRYQPMNTTNGIREKPPPSEQSCPRMSLKTGTTWTTKKRPQEPNMTTT